MGKAAGRANDMAMNAVGSMLGAATQVMGSWWSSPDAEQASRSFGEGEERACRAHFESTTRSGTGTARDYESARPLYQFGHLARQNPDYQNRSFEEVEPDLARAWENGSREQFGDWREVRDHVGLGYTDRTPGAPNPS
ncbi:MAG TPA: hypothetical protein VGR27_08060 [Longimicrobiaceae bacterium]|nr:hypothetical protein [Longimicrobiaceae bacterium]